MKKRAKRRAKTNTTSLPSFQSNFSQFWQTHFCAPEAYRPHFGEGKHDVAYLLNFDELLFFLRIGYVRPSPSEIVMPGDQTMRIIGLITSYLETIKVGHGGDDVLEIMTVLYDVNIIKTVDPNYLIIPNDKDINTNFSDGRYFILDIPDFTIPYEFKPVKTRNRFTVEYKENSVVYHV